MARDPQGALTALNRFGFGARGGAAGDFLNAASDPRGFVKAELARSGGALLELPGLPNSPGIAQSFYDYQRDQEAARTVARVNTSGLPAPPPTTPTQASMAVADAMQAASPAQTMTANPPDAPKPPPAPPLTIIQKTFRADALARIQRANIVDCGFVERLVVFWSNHFCISANKSELSRMWAGAFEREAIRPHVLGRFADMLKAVEQHPAMLLFLDNYQSFGPTSVQGQKSKRGLNENLAREILELHTLGVDGGYTQSDVTSLARILTGWTFAGRIGRYATPGTFFFFGEAHESGAHRLLGKTYEEAGLAQGEAALADIARHPATAKFVAAKFARHFVADDPPPALMARLEQVFRSTDGDLKALAAALVDDDEAWRAPASKMRTPYEYLIATGRLLARFPEEPMRYIGGLAALGQPLWSPSGPNGFADVNAIWAAPENVKLRLDIAAQIATRVPETVDPRELLDMAAGDAASQETRQTIERAESKQQAFALLLMSPEFQRR